MFSKISSAWPDVDALNFLLPWQEKMMTSIYDPHRYVRPTARSEREVNYLDFHICMDYENILWPEAADIGLAHLLVLTACRCRRAILVLRLLVGPKRSSRKPQDPATASPLLGLAIQTHAGELEAAINTLLLPSRNIRPLPDAITLASRLNNP